MLDIYWRRVSRPSHSCAMCGIVGMCRTRRVYFSRMNTSLSQFPCKPSHGPEGTYVDENEYTHSCRPTYIVNPPFLSLGPLGRYIRVMYTHIHIHIHTHTCTIPIPIVRADSTCTDISVIYVILASEIAQSVAADGRRIERGMKTTIYST